MRQQRQAREQGDGHVDRGRRRRFTQHVREIPAESNVWFNLGVAAMTIAAGAAIAAVGLVDHLRISEAVLWTVSAAAMVQAATCFVAHWDANRGRRVKRSVVEEEAEDFGG